MPSASPGRYQSKLFNFFHRQSRRLNEQLQQRFRKVKVNVTWSAEALLYPLYQLLQRTSEYAKKQLKSDKASQNNSQNTDLLSSSLDTASNIQSVDIPVNCILSAIDKIQFTNKRAIQSSSDIDSSIFQVPSYKPTIQGIACDILQRKLVLVSDENEILDILTPRQQQELEKLIIAEVAKYWRKWRLSQKRSSRSNIKNRLLQKITNLLTGVIGNKPALTQQNQDTQNLDTENLEKINRTQSQLVLINRPLGLLDNAIAKIESNALVPLSENSITVRKSSIKVFNSVRKKINIFLYGKEEAIILSEREEKVDSKVRNIEIRNKRIEPSAIKNLILAAIEYFFGEKQPIPLLKNNLYDYLKGNKLINNFLLTGNKSLNKAQLQGEINEDEETRDIWLALDSLFGQPEKKIGASINVNSKSELLRESLNIPQLSTILEIEERSISLQESSQTNLIINQNRSSKSESIEAQPDWIETKAQLVNYSKHPLEQLVEWLDNTMLFLEETTIKVFKWFSWLLNRKDDC